MTYRVLALVLAATFAGTAALAGTATPAPGLPPAAKPGQCFARVLVPATFNRVAQEVVTADAYEKVGVTQPKFTVRDEEVVTRDAHKRYVVREPVYRTETTAIVTRPAFERLVVVPGKTAVRHETVQIREPRLVWRPGTNLSGVRRVHPQTGEIFCLVEEPAKHQTVSRHVTVALETVKREQVPQQITHVQRHVLVEPARVEEIEVPATTKKIAIHELAAPATEFRVPVAERKATVYREVEATPERYEWVPVVCDTNLSAHTIRQLQQALARQGLYKGPIDGIAGPLTMHAVRSFQARNNIPHSGYLTVETLQKLGVAT